MVLTHSQIDDLIEVVRHVGMQEIMPRFRNLSGDEVESKSNARNLVTVADRAAEDTIRLCAEKFLPGASIVGEEAVAANPDLLDAIGASQVCVIIDPIDGTGNYVSGLAIFGTILAVVYQGQTIFGLLYDPVMDDWMFALRNEGSWFRRRDGASVQLHTKGECDLSSSTGFVALEDYAARDRAMLLRGFEPTCHVRDIRCSCHEYRILASGGADFIRSYALKPWDHAAGLLLLAEAGGWAAVNGELPYLPTIHSGKIIAASSEKLGRHIAKLTAELP